MNVTIFLLTTMGMYRMVITQMEDTHKSDIRVKMLPKYIYPT
jgi:hypothetical protein